MTQPIYARDQWDRLMDAPSTRWPSGLPRPVLLGILPLHSQRHAEFLHNEVPGITIPAEIRAAMGGAGERAAEVGLDIAHALLAEVADQVQGTYLMPSFGRYELAAELVRRIRADSRHGPGRSALTMIRRQRFLGLLAVGMGACVLLLPALVLAQPPAGPPFPPPENNVTVYDYAEPAVARRQRPRRPQTSPRIEQRTGAEVAIYTQYKPGSDEDSTLATPRP